MTDSRAPRRWLLVGVSALAALVLLSVVLAWHRIIQVDEAQNVMMARIIAFQRSDEFMASAPLMLLGPVMWIAEAASSSAGLFHQVRLLFAGLMWVNWVLMAKACGVRLRSGEGLILLLLAATLEPLWDYGFEIRHDNLLLTGLLTLWLLLRPMGRLVRGAHLLAGVLAVLMQLVAFKAFLYTAPLLAFFLFFPPAVDKPSTRWRPLTETLAGVLLGLLLGWSLHQLAGTWPLFSENFKSSASYSAGGVQRFPPWRTLHRLLVQVPLLVAASTVVLAALRFQLRGGLGERLLQLLTKPFAPELGLLLVCLTAFFANPTPYPYNLVLVVPALFIVVLRNRAPWVESIEKSPNAALIWSLLAAVHLVPWMASTPRHFDMSNDRQMQVATLAENLTDPSRHRVFDGAGLVPTRNPIGFYWLIHSFTIGPLSDGTLPSIRSQLSAYEVPVVLPNYRTKWLPEPDLQFIDAHYLPLSQDFFVLGTTFQRGEGQWMALASGNYFFSVQGPGERWVDVDNQRVPLGSVHLSRGLHHFRFPGQLTLTVTWSGPRSKSMPTLDDDPRPLFAGFY